MSEEAKQIVPIGTGPDRRTIFDPNRGLGPGQLTAPTLRSTSRMKNLVAARGEINRRIGAAGGFPYQAYVNHTEYARLDPNILLAYEPNPMAYIQDEFVYFYAYVPDHTVPIEVKGRIVETGTIKNRIIERSLTRRLSAALDPYFSNRSWAYRPNRSTEMAIFEVRQAIRRGLHWALKTDISSFFGSIKREILENQLRWSIADQDLCDMILTANSPNIRIGWSNIRMRTGGIPQGNILSPFLANLHLNGFDEACSRLDYRRYADDLFVLASSLEEIVAARQYIEQLLAELGLQLNEKKTFIRDLYRQPIVFLGFELRGGSVYPPRKAILRFEQQLRVRGQHARRDLMNNFVRRFHMGPVRKLFRRIDRELHSWYPEGVTLTGLLEGVGRAEQ